MADPTEQRIKEQRRAEALRANLKRRKAQTRANPLGRDTEPAVLDTQVPPNPDTTITRTDA
jgi:hypothetical protein